MSKRGKVLRSIRWREQVARLIAESMPVDVEQAGQGHWVAGILGVRSNHGRTRSEAVLRLLESIALEVLTGREFDVARAREYGERLVALGEHFEVFADWCREKHGVGPEAPARLSNAEVAAGLSMGRWSNRGLTIRDVQREAAGNWPGPLAREYGWEGCKACEGKGRGEKQTWAATHDAVLCECANWAREIGEPERAFARGDAEGLRHAAPCEHATPPKCPDCKGRGRVRKRGKPPGFANGRVLARMGRRLLAALEGQPSKCQRCETGHAWTCSCGTTDHDLRGTGWRKTWSDDAPQCPFCHQDWPPCSACQGTGHNLAGVLPPIVDSEAAVVAVADALRVLLYERDLATALWVMAGWQREVFDLNRSRVLALAADAAPGRPRTRVLARGKHREATPDEQPGAFTGMRASVASHGYEVGDRVRVSGYGVGRWAPHSSQQTRHEAGHDRESLMPRWRRGEIRHDRRRRAR